MKTNNQVSGSSHYFFPVTFGPSNRMFTLAMIAFLLFSISFSNVSLAASEYIYQPVQPVRPAIVPINDFTIEVKKIPSLQDYQECLLKAMDIIGNGVCTGSSDIRFCIKAQFVANSDNCALYL